jgi:hypothetical protein
VTPCVGFMTLRPVSTITVTDAALPPAQLRFHEST